MKTPGRTHLRPFWLLPQLDMSHHHAIGHSDWTQRHWLYGKPAHNYLKALCAPSKYWPKADELLVLKVTRRTWFDVPTSPEGDLEYVSSFSPLATTHPNVNPSGSICSGTNVHRTALDVAVGLETVGYVSPFTSHDRMYSAPAVKVEISLSGSRQTPLVLTPEDDYWDIATTPLACSSGSNNTSSFSSQPTRPIPTQNIINRALSLNQVCHTCVAPCPLKKEAAETESGWKKSFQRSINYCRRKSRSLFYPDLAPWLLTTEGPQGILSTLLLHNLIPVPPDTPIRTSENDSFFRKSPLPLRVTADRYLTPTNFQNFLEDNTNAHKIQEITKFWRHAIDNVSHRARSRDVPRTTPLGDID